MCAPSARYEHPTGDGSSVRGINIIIIIITTLRRLLNRGTADMDPYLWRSGISFHGMQTASNDRSLILPFFLFFKSSTSYALLTVFLNDAFLDLSIIGNDKPYKRAYFTSRQWLGRVAARISPKLKLPSQILALQLKCRTNRGLNNLILLRHLLSSSSGGSSIHILVKMLRVAGTHIQGHNRIITKHGNKFRKQSPIIIIFGSQGTYMEQIAQAARHASFQLKARKQRRRLGILILPQPTTIVLQREAIARDGAYGQGGTLEHGGGFVELTLGWESGREPFRYAFVFSATFEAIGYPPIIQQGR
mmetsp:Transcript_2872/g.6138  ORF Transcript_2872/g.6138 Transcript_2872/m.6138 type:complete len:304 (+) Transcript_2872:461-1372(+)